MTLSTNTIGVSTMICIFASQVSIRLLLLRVWMKQPDWAEAANLPEPSWTNRSPRRLWNLMFLVLRFDRHLRQSAIDALLLVFCWVANVGSWMLLGWLLVRIAQQQW